MKPLFRWPGPRAMSAALRGMPVRLSPGGVVWLHEDPAFTPGGRLFGALLVPDATALRLIRNVGGSWLGTESPVVSVWVPPVGFGIDLAGLDPDGVRSAIPGYDAALSDTVDALGAYLEELSALERAGVPSPVGPWCSMSAEDRRATLSAAGVDGRWTR